jgi:hypothetical protein
VARFLTHSLFGRGGLWNGKCFEQQNGEGINRFVMVERDDKPKPTTASPDDSSKLYFNHKFDYSLEPSHLSSNLQSLELRYRKHQHFSKGGWTSLLWKSMVDEVRMVECSNGECLLLGFGTMGWSGGIWNGSPFLLYRQSNNNDVRIASKASTSEESPTETS